MVYGLYVRSPVLRYRMHTSDSIFSVGSTKNVSHRSHLTRLWQHLMAQARSPANPLKKNPVSRCVNPIAGAPGVLVTVTCATSRRLDTSVGVSGPHDFSVRFRRSRLKAPSASTASCPALVTLANAPLGGTGWRENATDLGRAASAISVNRKRSLRQIGTTGTRQRPSPSCRRALLFRDWAQAVN
jgi:hypothetical protein